MCLYNQEIAFSTKRLMPRALFLQLQTMLKRNLPLLELENSQYQRGQSRFFVFKM